MDTANRGALRRITRLVFGRRLAANLGIVCALSAGGLPALASAADLSQQQPIEVIVKLGDEQNHLAFTPAKLTFDAGKLYKLVLENPSSSKHYFSALRFASAIWTRKVEVGGAEIKGATRELEIKPGGKAEWFFVPVQAGNFPLKCTVPSHAEAGMVGEITIE